MILTTEQLESFKDASKPLVKWLNENCHPMVSVIVEPTGTELLEGCAKIKIEEYIKD